MTIHDILERFRNEALHNRDLGDKFERLLATYLCVDPIYADRFDGVWMWSEWPLRWGADTGIDLVARERLTGEYCAIQCKFYDPAHTLQKGDIDAFFTASGKTFPSADGVKRFASRMLVSTTDRWSKHAEEAMTDQTIPVTRLRVQDLADSPIDWSAFSIDRPTEIRLRKKKSLRLHQESALADVVSAFETSDRGKLIMACGTGKTFTSLRIAERITGGSGLVLFLVPSISLLSQTLREWTAEAEHQFHAFAVCSDTKVGRHQEDVSAHDLALPATTDSRRLTEAVTAVARDRTMSVIFSTYQSIGVVAEAQQGGLPPFDIIVCDEAHRTTGVTLEDAEESHFVRVHRQDFIQAHKRLYMTATPRIFGDTTKTRAEEASAVLCSMDDETLYGPTFHRLGFGEAVSRGLLSDYKVLVLAVDEQHVSAALQRSLADANNEINVDDAVKIIGCWNGLAKHLIGDEAKDEDPAPMQRAVAFVRSIRDSKHLASMFEGVVAEYLERHGDQDGDLRCETEHVDGTFNVLQRNQKLDWLKAGGGADTCRILSNARCLSEGVDVPALDAVLFLNPRDSVVDVVQSVGRVMRRAEGKKYGYVILPIGVPAGVPPEVALQDNQRYRVVWQVLQALRAHDDRFNATVNQLDLNKNRPTQIRVIGVGGRSEGEEGESTQPSGRGDRQLPLAFPDIEAWKDAIYAKIVVKCGDRRYWEDWARDVAQIAERHTQRIKAVVDAGGPAAKAFEGFLSGLHENINNAIDAEEAIEMLSQHLITRPVFDALFDSYSFTKHNPVSRAMQDVLDVLEGHSLEKEVGALEGFYESVRRRVRGIDNSEGRQRVIVELYDKFFKLAFPKMSERLGIVYTPVEVVDFIVHSCEHALRQHLGAGLTDKGVHVIDPFTGTGTFIVRLLQSGLIKPADLERKFRQELHANEIVLLAYYIAAVNVEATYHELAGGPYEPYDGIVLTDTFQLAEEGEQKGFGEAMFPENNRRVKAQKSRPIRVVMSNPPYSAQQDSENDNNANLKYPLLDERIRQRYAERSSGKLRKSYYDSYVRAIRWASDRIESAGVIGFVTNASFVDASNLDGLRKSLAEEFSTIYVLHLRGLRGKRTGGEKAKQEGGQIFAQGSGAAIAVTILVRDQTNRTDPVLYFHDIGDYLSRDDKLKRIRDFGHIGAVPWTRVTPNDEGDWINQRTPEFDAFMPIGNKAGTDSRAIFSFYSLGVVTNRDPWTYSFGSESVTANMSRLISFYNQEVERYQRACDGKAKDKRPQVDDFIASDTKLISWTRSLKQQLAAGRKHEFDATCIITGAYRPFVKMRMYFNRRFNEMVYLVPKLFPSPAHKNVVISVIGVVERKGFSVLAADHVPNLHLTDTGQCFPLYWYERIGSAVDESEDGPASSDLFHDQSIGSHEEADEAGYIRRDAISDSALNEFRIGCEDSSIGKEDLFYYVYGVLHAPSYRTKFDASLRKVLPRIPMPAGAAAFWAFSRAGRALAALHIGYESVEPFPLQEEVKGLALDAKEFYRVEKMAFAKNSKAIDKSAIVFNSRVRLSGIPLEAYEYVVNGKSAIEWVMERYAVTLDKESGIRNDPNDWSDDPRYVVDLVRRVVRVSIETVRIVNSLPAIG